jgi:hypothetical protein
MHIVSMKSVAWEYAGTSIVCAPLFKRVTCSNTVTFTCKMLENVLCDAYRTWEQQIPNAVSANQSKAQQDPCLASYTCILALATHQQLFVTTSMEAATAL